MPTYIVQWKYASSQGGPWFPGDEIELTSAAAEAINLDSPGVLLGPLAGAPDDLTAVAGIGEQAAKALRAGGVWSFAQLAAAQPAELVKILLAQGQLAAGDDADEAELHAARVAAVTGWQNQLAALLQARQDRMHAATHRRDRVGDPSDQGVMTRADSGMVKDKPAKAGKGKGK